MHMIHGMKCRPWHSSERVSRRSATVGVMLTKDTTSLSSRIIIVFVNGAERYTVPSIGDPERRKNWGKLS